MNKIGQKTKFRVTFLLLGFIISSVFFVSQFFSYITQIMKTKQEIYDLEVAYNDKLHEEEVLNDEISKLEDPEYLAKYAREKYLYSKKDEIIIKIEE
ncbi:MAG: septum formation initiator family protein [bacterium]|nr:septum formation initiator family protein [bacterium]